MRVFWGNEAVDVEKISTVDRPDGAVIDPSPPTAPPLLAGQTVQNQVREVGINPNHWYAVAEGKQVKPNGLRPLALSLSQRTGGHRQTAP